MQDTSFAGAPLLVRAEIGGCVEGPELAGPSATIARVRELVQRVAALGGGVLLTALRGTDVASIARTLHHCSARAAGPFVAVDCGEAEALELDHLIFGAGTFERPADLDAVSSESRLAAACGGTLFLQSITDMPAGVQGRLARIARDGEVRIGGAIARADIRFIASALPSIDGDVDAQRFRSDLYRRLSACRIDLPSLGDRPEDVPAIAAQVLAELCAARNVPTRRLTEPALSLLAALTWPGNLAELRSVLERVLGSTADDELQTEHVLPALGLHRARAPFTPSGNLRDARLRFERDYIAAVLQHHGWRMADAAATLGIQRPNLYRKARQLGIPLTRISE